MEFKTFQVSNSKGIQKIIGNIMPALSRRRDH